MPIASYRVWLTVESRCFIGFARWGVRLSMEHAEGRPVASADHSPIVGRRGAVVATTLLATIGIWAIALWAWLDGGSLRALLSDPTTVGAPTPSVKATADRGAAAPLAAQPPPVTTTTGEKDSPPAPVQQLTPPDRKPTEPVIQVPATAEQPPASRLATAGSARPSVRTPVPDISPAVVRGSQPSPAPEVASDNSTAVFRGNQSPASDSGPAVVRGTRALAGPSSP
jgi:hypothetical protein